MLPHPGNSLQQNKTTKTGKNKSRHWWSLAKVLNNNAVKIGYGGSKCSQFLVILIN